MKTEEANRIACIKEGFWVAGERQTIPIKCMPKTYLNSCLRMYSENTEVGKALRQWLRTH